MKNNFFTSCFGAGRALSVLRLMLGLLSFLTTPAHADVANVRSIMKQRGLTVAGRPFNPASVNETLIKGLYRWDLGRDVGQAYVNEAATLFLYTDGTRIIDWQQQGKSQPLSEADKALLLSEMIKNIRFDKLIHIKHGSGANQILLVSAFDCPTCIQFERMLDKAGNRVDADIYILPSTLQQRSNPNVSTVHNLWCANDNASLWRATVVQASRGYFMLPSHSCDLSIRATQDVELLLHTLAVFKGYPFVVFGNGKTATPPTDEKAFVQLMNRNAGKAFWTQPQPDKYAYFGASAGFAEANGGTGGAVNGTELIKGLFQRFGQSSGNGSNDQTPSTGPQGM